MFYNPFEELSRELQKTNMKEQVNHPEHYSSNGIEAIDVIDAYKLNFNLGNAIKYILRAEKKGNKKIDLEKSVWYLNREIDKFHG